MPVAWIGTRKYMIDELSEKLSCVLNASKTTMIQMRVSGFISEMAKVYAKLLAELMEEGFSREEAMRIVVNAKFGAS